MVREELRVAFSGKVREEAVLACCKGEAADILAGDGLAVQAHAAVISKKPQYALHECGLACAVFAKQADYLAGAEL